MVNVDDCILGNSALHARFFATTEILAKLVSSAPRAVSMTQLEDATARDAKELTKLCNHLARAGLLHHESSGSDQWMLSCDPARITLEDVFRCALATQPQRAKPAAKKAAARIPGDVDLLVMQAMIAVNQSVFKHLRQFPLDRLKISAAGTFPVSRPALGDACADDGFDVAIPGRKAMYDAPVQLVA